MTVNLISLSGGKDSTAMLLLALERGAENLRVIFCDTGNEHPLTYAYIDYLRDRLSIKIETLRADFSEKLKKRRENLPELWRAKGISEERIEKAVAALEPTGNPFLDLAMLKGCFPASTSRFCTQELKVSLIRNQVYKPLLSAGEDAEAWQGIRWQESRSRACAKERDLAMKSEETGAEIWNYRPILAWKAADCFAMLKKHGVDPNPLYKLGMNRVGCMPCIFCHKTELAEISARFPEVIDRIDQWERRVSVCSPRGGASFFSWRLGAKNIRDMVAWSKTERGGYQYGLLDNWSDLPACSSLYGLCE